MRSPDACSSCEEEDHASIAERVAQGGGGRQKRISFDHQKSTLSKVNPASGPAKSRLISPHEGALTGAHFGKPILGTAAAPLCAATGLTCLGVAALGEGCGRSDGGGRGDGEEAETGGQLEQGAVGRWGAVERWRIGAESEALTTMSWAKPSGSVPSGKSNVRRPISKRILARS